MSQNKREGTSARSSGERLFETLWSQLAPLAPRPEAEYRFDSYRRFRFDFAWPKRRVAVEIDGGAYSGGRHVRAAGFERDLEKHNLAQAAKWSVFRITPQQLEKNPWPFISMVARSLSDA